MFLPFNRAYVVEKSANGPRFTSLTFYYDCIVRFIVANPTICYDLAVSGVGFSPPTVRAYLKLLTAFWRLVGTPTLTGWQSLVRQNHPHWPFVRGLLCFGHMGTSACTSYSVWAVFPSSSGKALFCGSFALYFSISGANSSSLSVRITICSERSGHFGPLKFLIFHVPPLDRCTRIYGHHVL